MANLTPINGVVRDQGQDLASTSLLNSWPSNLSIMESHGQLQITGPRRSKIQAAIYSLRLQANGITMADGTHVMPTQGRDSKGRPFSNLTWSKDHGKTWHVSSHARDNTTECAIAELSDGSLMLNMRDNRNRDGKGATNGRAVSTTKDLGKTWSKHSSDHGALPEPTCMASLISLKHTHGKHVLFFSNPNSKKGRSKMTIQMSLDDGKNWPTKHHILLDTKGGAYSSLVEVDDQTIGILYESSAADMIFQKIQLKDFIK